MRFRHLLAGVAAVALTAPPALAQNTEQPQAQQMQQPEAQQSQPPQAQSGQSQGQESQLAAADMDFAKEAAQGGLMEVRLGELAQQQGTAQAVKDFGQRMVEDHGKANDKLKQIAEQKGVTLPQDLSEDAQQSYEDLQQKSGADFDQAYMDEMVSDHEDTVAAFEDYAKNAQDPDLRAFAEETLPTLREHLQMAKQTDQQVASAGQAEQPAPAMAANEPTQEQQGQEQPQVVNLDEVLGSSVVNESGEEVGEIEDVVVKDEAQYAVVSVGGFLGIGDKDVAIPLDELKLGEDQTYLMTGQTEDQLEQLPAYDETQYQPYQR